MGTKINRLRTSLAARRSRSGCRAWAAPGWVGTVLTFSMLSCSPAGQPLSGLNLDLVDSTARPQDDLYRFANGRWLATTTIPADRSSVGVWQDLSEDVIRQIRAIAEGAASETAPAGSLQQQIGDFYASYLDTTRIRERGLEPLRHELARMDSMTSPTQLGEAFGRLERFGGGSPLRLYVAADRTDPERHVVYATQSGLTLPSREHYLGQDPASRAIRDTAYLDYVSTILALAGTDRSRQHAGAILRLETALAAAQWTPARSREARETHNVYSVEGLDSIFPGHAWTTLLREAGLGRVDSIVVLQPGYVSELGKLLTASSLDTWRAYLRFKLLDASAPYLPEAFVEAHFAFHERTLKGRSQAPPRWERAVDLLNEMIGDGVGQLWVARYFPPQTKGRLETYVALFVNAFRQGIDSLTWMSDATKIEAKRKLERLRIHVGYPDEWPDYSTLHIDRHDLLGNVRRAAAYAQEQDVADLVRRPRDVDGWVFPPQTVVAYAIPTRNELYLSAGNLLPPYFMPEADLAYNFAATGMLLGHEISHLFDDQGRRYDAEGALHNWWSPEDAAEFARRADRLVGQFNQYHPFPDMAVDGRRTLGENIADLAGAEVAFRAYRSALNGRELDVIDGFSGDQRFFLAWAQLFRVKRREENSRLRLSTNSHAPAVYRVDGVASNMDAFYRAFDVSPGDALYRPPSERVRIW